MTKKGYQKRLPTVLVPAPRTAPHEELPTSSPAREAGLPVPADPSPDPVHATDVPRRSSSARLAAAAIVGLVVLGVTGVRLTSMLAGDDAAAPPGHAAAFGTQPPVQIGAGDSYVDLRVVENGDVEATQWIAAAEPLDRLRLELPELAGAPEVTASVVMVLADGEVVAGPNRVTGRGATYVLDSATDVQVSYRLTGAVVLSDSVPGRALAAAGMDVGYAPRSRRETRVVRAPGMLSLACGDPDSERLVPCGEETGPEEWSVDLAGPEVEDRLVVQLTLG